MTPKAIKLKDALKGDTFNGYQFTIIDYNTRVAIDLTGASLKCQFRSNKKTGSVIVTLTDGSGLSIVDAVNGIIQIDRIENLDWRVGLYYFDIQTNFLNGDIKTYVEGTININQDVTT